VRGSPKSLLASPDVAAAARSASGIEVVASREDMQALNAETDFLENLLAPLVAARDKKTKEAADEAAMMRNKQVWTECDGLKKECEGLKKECEGLKKECEGLKHECEGLKKEVAELTTAARHTAALKVAVSDGAHQSAVLREQLQQARSLNDDLTAEIVSLSAQLRVDVASAAAAVPRQPAPVSKARIVQAHELRNLKDYELNADDILFAM
jgi:predicted RNase H-like nuclease (RuvC/YqgF family)